MNAELKILAKKFSNYRGSRLKVKYPSYLWKEAHALSQAYSPGEIAEALGVSATHLERKFKSFSPTINFARIEIEQPLSKNRYQLEFAASNGSKMRLEFEGSSSDLQGLVKSLAGIK